MPVTTAEPPSPKAIERTVEQLRNGGLALLATDTVYGIVADIRRDDAVDALYAAKGKRRREPLQLLCSTNLEVLNAYAELTQAAGTLIDALGPGPWTIITTAAQGWTSPALAGGVTAGLRLPPTPTIQAVIAGLGAPLAASSANRHGERSPTTCAQAVASLGRFCAAAIDDGPTPEGVDSTVVDCSRTPPRVLREGAIPAATIATHLGLEGIEVVRRVGV